MENKVSYKLRASVMKILMEECLEVYLLNYPEKRGKKFTYDDMFEEAVTFYRDAEGLIIREKPKLRSKDGKK